MFILPAADNARPGDCPLSHQGWQGLARCAWPTADIKGDGRHAVVAMNESGEPVTVCLFRKMPAAGQHQAAVGGTYRHLWAGMPHVAVPVP